MVLSIPTGDDAEENDTVYLYWGRNGRLWRCMYHWRRYGRLPQSRSPLGTLWLGMGQ